MDAATTTLIVTTVAGLLKLFWSDYQSNLREKRAEDRAIREREWQVQNRRIVAQELASKVEGTAAGLAETTAQAAGEIKKAIAVNTAITNNTNRQIATVAEQLAQPPAVPVPPNGD